MVGDYGILPKRNSSEFTKEKYPRHKQKRNYEDTHKIEKYGKTDTLRYPLGVVVD